MKGAQFQRFLALHAKKYGLLTKDKVFKQTGKGRARFYIRADKLNLLEMATMYHDFKTYASNRSVEASWRELINAVRGFTVPAINVVKVHRQHHEQEFLLWIGKLEPCVADGIRREVIGLAARSYHNTLRENKALLESILPRALAAVFLYKACISHELCKPVSLDYLAAEVMLSTPTLQKAKQKLEGT